MDDDLTNDLTKLLSILSQPTQPPKGILNIDTRIIPTQPQMSPAQVPPVMQFDQRPIPPAPYGAQYPTLEEMRRLLRSKQNGTTPYFPTTSGGFVRG